MGSFYLIISVLLALAFLFTLARLVVGPTLADRVVALDLLGFVILGFIGINMLRGNQTIYLDVLVVAAIVLFLGTIAVARYLEKRKR
jgi:multicomponent Na+:H+ antiporter subunit F